MIKGINKQMIVLKLENNRLYESACFLLRADTQRKKQEEGDMLSEANRILAEMDIKKPKRATRGGFRRFLGAVLLVLLGAALGFGGAFFLLL
jgi:hypothetical protein